MATGGARPAPGKLPRSPNTNSACHLCFESKTKCDKTFPCTRCFRNSLPCRPRVRGGGDGLALLAQRRGVEDSAEHHEGDAALSESWRRWQQGTGDEEGAACGGGGGGDGPAEERVLRAMVVERLEGRRMMEGYLRAIVELHRQGGVDMASAKSMLHCWRQMSLLSGHDVTMGMADTVARFLYMTPLAIESQGDVLLDAPLFVRRRRQAAVLEQWATLAPRLRASDVFRRAEAGGRVGVLMSVVDEEGDGLPDLKLVQTSNVAYDRLLGKALQTLQDSIHKCCIIAFIIGCFISPMDRDVWWTAMVRSLFAERKERLVLSDFIKIFDRRGEMRLLLMHITTTFRTAAELGLKAPEEPGAKRRKFVQVITFEPVPPSRYINDRPTSLLHRRTKLFRRFDVDDSPAHNPPPMGVGASLSSSSVGGGAGAQPTAPLPRPAAMAAAAAEEGEEGEQQELVVPFMAIPAAGPADAGKSAAAVAAAAKCSDPGAAMALFRPLNDFQWQMQARKGAGMDSPIEPWRVPGPEEERGLNGAGAGVGVPVSAEAEMARAAMDAAVAAGLPPLPINHALAGFPAPPPLFPPPQHGWPPIPPRQCMAPQHLPPIHPMPIIDAWYSPPVPSPPPPPEPMPRLSVVAAAPAAPAADFLLPPQLPPRPPYAWPPILLSQLKQQPKGAPDTSGSGSGSGSSRDGVAEAKDAAPVPAPDTAPSGPEPSPLSRPPKKARWQPGPGSPGRRVKEEEGGGGGIEAPVVHEGKDEGQQQHVFLPPEEIRALEQDGVAGLLSLMRC